MMNLPRWILLPIAAMCGLAQGAEKVALVVGNGLYDSTRPANEAPNLANPTHDAAAFMLRLKEQGFQVQHIANGTARDMARGLNQFREAARGADFALFYFAGHGIEISTEDRSPRNYLLPVDARLEEPEDEKVEAVPLQTVLDEMKGSGARLKVVILDCCRNNPFGNRSWLRTRSAGGGLAEVPEKDLPEGTMIVFSGAPGMTVPDGSGRHSPFTDSLLKEWRSGLSVPAIVSSVVDKVTASEPWIRFDGSGRTFAAFQSYRLGGGGGAALEESKSQPGPLMSPPEDLPAADMKWIDRAEASSILGKQSTRAEGTITYGAMRAFDGDKSTAWVEGAAGTGMGEWIEVTFSRTVKMSGVSIIPGYAKNADIFSKNGRVRRLEMVVDSDQKFTLSFDDQAKYHRFELGEPLPVRSVRFRILEAIRGSKYEDTAISDILFE